MLQDVQGGVAHDRRATYAARQRCEAFSLTYTSTKRKRVGLGASPKTHSLALCACIIEQ